MDRVCVCLPMSSVIVVDGDVCFGKYRFEMLFPVGDVMPLRKGDVYCVVNCDYVNDAYFHYDVYMSLLKLVKVSEYDDFFYMKFV